MIRRPFGHANPLTVARYAHSMTTIFSLPRSAKRPLCAPISVVRREDLDS